MIATLGWLWALYRAVQGFTPTDGQPCPWCGRTSDYSALEARVAALEVRP